MKHTPVWLQNLASKNVNRKRLLQVTAGVLVVMMSYSLLVMDGAQASVPFSPSFDLTDPSTQLIREKSLYNDTVLQSIAFDNVNERMYTLQLISGGRQLSGETAPVSGAARANNGDLCLTELDLFGNITGHMYLKGFGHGVSFGAEPVGSSTYLWTEVDAVSDGSNGWGTQLGRFKFVNGAVITNTSSSITKYALLSGVDRTTCNIDMVNGYLTMRYRQNGSFRYGVFNLEAVKAGNAQALVDVPHPAGLGTFQGFASFGSYLYLLDGVAYNDTTSISPNGNTYITTVNLNSGAQVDRQLTKASYTLSYREPEGMAIQIPNVSNPSAARLCFGFASKVSKTNSSKLASIYYKDALE